MSLLDVRNLSVMYGELQVLYDISFRVERGECVTVLGANAAGKTTTLRAVSGLLSGSKGQVFFSDQRIDNMPPHERIELGLIQIPEGRLVFPFLSVLENLELGAYSARARRDRSTSLTRVWDLFPVLKDRGNQLAGSLSGGEQQMLALGRGLMAMPKLLMLDEPSLGLAPILQEQLMTTIEQLHEEGITVLLVEQNVTHALRIADRGYVLEKGSIVMEDEATTLAEDDRLREAYMGL